MEENFTSSTKIAGNKFVRSLLLSCGNPFPMAHQAWLSYKPEFLRTFAALKLKNQSGFHPAGC